MGRPTCQEPSNQAAGTPPPILKAMAAQHTVERQHQPQLALQAQVLAVHRLKAACLLYQADHHLLQVLAVHLQHMPAMLAANKNRMIQGSAP